ncbi:hypothetical protein HanXRQr2_Chr14g0623791 [Helianthus annuus]|uniref:Uncharacterized protein n=1 Tax=Helianthus annuus TaxID=4232 RepID=A0A9K3E5Y1_HELAN|nr:hypothetical protein HanXRQr2_Chr14g0623791 [Helianthus annuus]KAJ0838761.1 hypothetical protein HanPSC8_Chr14g0598631 [Helianthus annuus]
MAAQEHIYNLFDSYWFQHQILTNNPVSEIQDHPNEDIKQEEKYEILELTRAMSCGQDVEVKGLLRFWAHSVASAIS